MRRINIYKRTIGLNFNEQQEAEVMVWAPLAHMVSIQHNHKLSSLNKSGGGYWTLTIPRLQEGDKYGFVLDGKDPLPDPASLLQEHGVHQLSSALNTSEFKWTDHSWQNIDLQDFIIYELHTGTFSSEGTFSAIEEKLDYLVGLGITAIELMPIAQFPGERNWGYDGVFPFAVQKSYGGPLQLQKLVNACHQKGLAVILDVVYNHLGPEGNYLGAYGPYFTEKYKTPWGAALNFDDSWCDGVREYFIENVLMWFRDFHIDALRMDAVHAIKDFSPKHILQEIKEYVAELKQVTGREHYLIIECDLNDTRFIKPIQSGGYGMDGQWTDEFHHALRVTAGQQRDGYYADFNGIGHLAKAYTDAYVYDGQYSEERHKKFGVKAKGHSGHQFVVFSQNHDQVGNRAFGERTSILLSFEMQKLLAAAVMVSPYLPMLFMGEEYGEPHPFLYFVSHSDPDLVAAVRNGRKEEFKHFINEKDPPDPQAAETFQTSKLQWELLRIQPHQCMFNYYKALIGLRKTHAALNSGDRENMSVYVDTEQNVLALYRWNGSDKLVCLMNFSNTTVDFTLTISSGNWQKLFDSAAVKWQGPADAPDTINNRIVLQPESVTIYKQ
jgi:maltooligosyltrehalose trehalohydrolase